LAALPTVRDARVLVGPSGRDDAAVYLVREDLVAVQSIDVFGPVVDDPYDYGRIAAANALSDLWAMGVDPAFAVAFAGFPTDQLPMSVLGEILRGGAELAGSVGVPVIGGHTIRDPEPKYGLAVTGFAHPDAVLTNGGARPGDRLFLTKPLGSGVLTTALKRGHLDDASTRRVVDAMVALNRGAAHAARAVGVHAATDVTGFGLLGHLRELCEASGVSARIDAGCLPHMEGVMDAIADGFVPGGTRRNLEAIQGICRFEPGIDEGVQLLMADAQTSGGLLLAVPEVRHAALREALQASDALVAAEIGTLEACPAGTPRIVVSGGQ
jgi:selenide,water dikinase